MKALFLDDMKERHKSFHNFYKNDFDEITYVYDYDEFVAEMKDGSHDILFLDHDLSVNTINMDPDDYDERSGTDVAKWISEEMGFIPREDKPGIVVHSMNPIGRERMVDILRDGGFEATPYPFIRLMSHRLVFS